MKLRQGELKKTMKGILAGAFLLAAGSAAVFAAVSYTHLKESGRGCFVIHEDTEAVT